MSTKNKENIPVTTSKGAIKASRVALNPISEIEATLERFFRHSLPSLWRWNNAPLVDNLFEAEGLRLPNLDVIDRDVDILVRAEIPGIEKKDLNVSLTDKLLTIKGQSSNEKKEDRDDYHRHEISSSSFARSVILPSAVDISKTVANLKDGILEITLPKVESAKRRNIAIQ